MFIHIVLLFFLSFYNKGLAAEYLVGKFGEIAENKLVNQKIRGGKKFKFPSFHTEVDKKVMPIGFRWNSSPDETLECDLPLCAQTESCAITSLACGHSFHTGCLRREGKLVPCPVCWPNLKNEITKLATSWNSGLLNPQQTSPEPESNDQSTDSPNDSVPEIPVSSTSPSLYSDLKHKIDGFPTPSTITYSSASARRTVQTTNSTAMSSAAQQTATTSTESTSQAMSATSAAQQTATTSTESTSQTMSATSTSPRTNAMSAERSSAISAPQQLAATSTMSTSPLHSFSIPVISSQQHGNVTSWMFPQNYSQSTIFGRTQGSNACTFIALLTGSAYVANASILQQLPNCGDLPNAWFIVLAQCMVNGNRLYDAATQHTPSVMFGVREAAEAMKQLARIAYISQEHQCDFEATLESARLSTFLKNLNNDCVAVNINSSRTTVYMKSHTDFIFFDSHRHQDGMKGAVLVKADHSSLDQLLLWVKDVNRMQSTLGTVTIVRY